VFRPSLRAYRAADASGRHRCSVTRVLLAAGASVRAHGPLYPGADLVCRRAAFCPAMASVQQLGRIYGAPVYDDGVKGLTAIVSECRQRPRGLHEPSDSRGQRPVWVGHGRLAEPLSAAVGPSQLRGYLTLIPTTGGQRSSQFPESLHPKTSLPMSYLSHWICLAYRWKLWRPNCKRKASKPSRRRACGGDCLTLHRYLVNCAYAQSSKSSAANSTVWDEVRSTSTDQNQPDSSRTS
jgi:hypothetical protein